MEVSFAGTCNIYTLRNEATSTAEGIGEGPDIPVARCMCSGEGIHRVPTSLKLVPLVVQSEVGDRERNPRIV